MKPYYRALLAITFCVLVLMILLQVATTFALLFFLLVGIWKTVGWIIDFWYEYFDV